MGTTFRAVVIGGSAGGIEPLKEILVGLSPDFELPILVVQHLHPSDDGAFVQHMIRATRLCVVEPRDKEPVLPRHVYIAPANYHMLVERDETIALSVDEKVNWSRPSIDVLFESAALTWGERLIAVILSGANQDGAKGMLAVKAQNGQMIAQDPTSAENPVMPQAAIQAARIETVLSTRAIVERLRELGRVHDSESDEPTGFVVGERE